MLNSQQLHQLFTTLGLAEEAQAVVNAIRLAPPSRQVKARVGNVTVRYASRKMGQIIQAESHQSELAFIYLLEHDPQVLEFYDQPPAFKLTYQRPNGKKLGSRYTPDFFVIRQNRLGWVECKTEEELLKLAEKDPQRYRRDEAGIWSCPPAAAHATSLGLSFEVWSTAQVDWVYLNNLQFLEDFLQPTRSAIAEAAQTEIIELVRQQAGIRLKELLGHLAPASSDDVYALIAQEQIYFDMYSARLSDRLHVRLFPDIQSAQAFKPAATPKFDQLSTQATLVHLVAGEKIRWDGKPWLIANVGVTSVSLFSQEAERTEVVELPNAVFETLLKQGKLQGYPPADQNLVATPTTNTTEIKVVLAGAAPADLAEANQRALSVRSFLNKELNIADVVAEYKISERTFWRWVKSYRQAEQRYNSGNGYVGLLPQTKRRGNRKPKLAQATLELMQAFIEQEYETPKQKNIYAVWGAFGVKCVEQGLTAPTYKIFTKAVKARPRYEQTLKRQGAKAAYQNEPFYWQLEYTTPRHGDYPFQICHIDHTELDLELRHSSTGGNMGRPWVTFLSDAFSRRILAFYLTYDPPSYRSCMMVLRECVQRHGRLPQTLVADGGKEFHSVYFETLLARYECHLKTRPAAKPRFGSVCERLFGTTNTRFIYNLAGNTQATKEVRQLTASVNPKKLAIWTLEGFYQHLRRWVYQEYDSIRHPALGQAPQQAFTAGVVESGRRLSRLIAYDEDFVFTTLPSTPKGTAQVQVNRGLKINNIYYWHPSFSDPLIERNVVMVRYDPFNVGVAYAYVKDRWLECLSEFYSFFKEHSEREIKLATNELHRQNREQGRNSVVTARQLALFLNEVEAEEALSKQRWRDQEATKVRQQAGRGRAATQNATQVPPPNQLDTKLIALPPKVEGTTTTESPALTDLSPKPKGRHRQSKLGQTNLRPTKLTIYEDY